jgi:hypothetical protein
MQALHLFLRARRQSYGNKTSFFCFWDPVQNFLRQPNLANKLLPPETRKYEANPSIQDPFFRTNFLQHANVGEEKLADLFNFMNSTWAEWGPRSLPHSHILLFDCQEHMSKVAGYKT